MMSRYVIATVFLVALGACAVVEDPVEEHRVGSFQAIDSDAEWQRVDMGLVTVAQVRPRSDIAQLPPSVEHVIWRRGSEASLLKATARAATEPSAGATEQRTNRVVDHWPLLARDMDMDSVIRELPMCARTTPCEMNETCAELEPCEHKELYDCYTTKIGNYCLEKL